MVICRTKIELDGVLSVVLNGQFIRITVVRHQERHIFKEILAIRNELTRITLISNGKQLVVRLFELTVFVVFITFIGNDLNVPPRLGSIEIRRKVLSLNSIDLDGQPDLFVDLAFRKIRGNVYSRKQIDIFFCR